MRRFVLGWSANRGVRVVGHGVCVWVLLCWVCFGAGSGESAAAWIESADESQSQAPAVAEEWTWFDSQTGELRPVPLSDEANSTAQHRGSGWAATPANPTAPPPVPAGGGGLASWLSQGISTVVWGGLIALLIFLAIMVIRWMLRRDSEREDRFEPAVDRSIDMTRIEELPFEVPATDGEFLERARKARQAGRMREATTLLYAYLLLQLDRRQWIELARGKTNRQYLRELREAPAGIREFLSQTIVIFEDAFFGDRPPSEEEFDRHWGVLDELRRTLAMSGGAT